MVKIKHLEECIHPIRLSTPGIERVLCAYETAALKEEGIQPPGINDFRFSGSFGANVAILPC